MALFDGLRNGFPEYFMYQPSQGLNPNILMGAAQMMRAGRTGTSGTGTTKKETEGKEPKLLQGTFDRYADMKSSIDSREDSIKNKMIGDIMDGEDPIATQEKYKPQLLEAQKYKVELNKYENEGLVQYDQWKGLSDKIQTDRTGSNVALIRNQPIAVDKTGKFIDTYVPDEKDSKKMVLNPEMQSFMTNDQYLNHVNKQGFFGKEGMPQNIEVPNLYDPNLSYEQTYQRIVEAASKFNTGYSSEQMSQDLAKPRFKETFIKNNYTQILTSIANDPSLIMGGQSTYSSALSDYYAAVQKGLNVAVKNPDYKAGSKKDNQKNEFKNISAKSASFEEFIADRAFGIGSAFLSRDIDTKGGTGEGLGDNTLPEQANIDDILNNNGTYNTKDVAIPIPIPIPDTGGKTLKEGDIFSGSESKPYTMLLIPSSKLPAGYAKSRDNAIDIPTDITGSNSFPLVKDKLESTGITQFGVVIDFNDMPNTHVTGYVHSVSMPEFKRDAAGNYRQTLNYETNEAGDKMYTNRKNEDGSISSLPNVAYVPYDGWRVESAGSDIRKKFLLPDVDEKAMKEKSKDIEMPRDIAFAENRRGEAVSDMEKYDKEYKKTKLKGFKNAYDKAKESYNRNNAIVSAWEGDNAVPSTETDLQYKIRTAGKKPQQFSYTFREISYDKKGNRIEGELVPGDKIEKDKYYSFIVYNERGVLQGISSGTTETNYKKESNLLRRTDEDVANFSYMDQMTQIGFNNVRNNLINASEK